MIFFNKTKKNNKNREKDIIDIWNVKILLQWRIGKEKVYEEETQVLRCIWVDQCSVNLVWEIENSKRWLSYTWYKNDEIFFENMNPPAQWLETWEHEIIFEIYDAENLVWSSIFFVIVEWKENSKNIKSQKEFQDEPHLFNTLVHEGIEIYDFLADPLWSDAKEFIELRNTTSEARDLYGCYLEDKAKRKYRFKQGEYLHAYEQRRFFRTQTKLTLWNQSGRIALICNNKEVQNISWETKVREWFSYLWKRVEIFQPEYIRSELSDEHYENYVKNAFSFSARTLKYDGLRVRGEALPHSTLTWYIDWQRFFTLTTGPSGRYSFDTKQIRSGKHQVDLTLTDMFWDTFELEPRTFTLQAEKMSSWYTPRSAPTPRTPILKIVSKTHAEWVTDIIRTQDTTLRRFFLYSLFILVVLVAIWHLFLLAFPPTMAVLSLIHIWRCRRRG